MRREWDEMLEDEERATRAELLARAIEGLRAIASAAREGYERERALAGEEDERPKRSTQGPRYLALPLAAQRNIARLQGVNARRETPLSEARFTISEQAAGPENIPPVSRVAPPEIESLE